MNFTMDLTAIICAVVAVFASGGFWQWLGSRADKKGSQAMALRAILHDRICWLGETYINRGYITRSEYESLDEMYRPYIAMGGNGTARKVMQEVEKLPTTNARKEKADGKF